MYIIIIITHRWYFWIYVSAPLTRHIAKIQASHVLS